MSYEEEGIGCLRAEHGRDSSDDRSGRRGKGQSGRLILFLMVLFLSLCTGIGIAAAAEESASEPTESPSFFPVEEDPPPMSLISGGDQQSVLSIADTDPQAAEEMQLENIGRTEAEELFSTVFPSAAEVPAGIFHDLEVESFNSDYAAVVTPDQSLAEGEEPALLTSTIPLRAPSAEGNEELVDLDLVQVDGSLRPTNPLVEVEIPADLQDGVLLPESGVTIELAGAPERAPTTLEESTAFYPNVAADTDLTISPTPTGVETYTVLRSPDAPTSQRFDLDIPEAAHLEATGDGGAQVTKGDETLLRVMPPAAFDAEGESVPVALDVEGSSIALHVSPGADAAYPILVDPVYQTYTWYSAVSAAGIIEDWVAGSNSPSFTAAWVGNHSGTLVFGLNLRSTSGPAFLGAQSTYSFYVPRYFTDFADPAIQVRPTSFIKSMSLSQVFFWIEEGAPVHAHPYFEAGIWSEGKADWVSRGAHTSAEGQYSNVTLPTFPNPDEVTDAKRAAVNLMTWDPVAYPRHLLIGAAALEISDKDSPAFAKIGSVGWMNDVPSGPISYEISDPGLGVYQLQLSQPNVGPGSKEILTAIGCDGTTSKPCPRTAKSADKPISYEPDKMPTGEHLVPVTATDPIGHKSGIGNALVKVDHTPPTLALSGTATEQGKLGTNLSEYTLKYSAADGIGGTATAQIPFGSLGSGNGQLNVPRGIAADGKGSVYVVDSANNRIEKFSEAGGYQGQFGSKGSGNGQFNEPAGVTITAAGNIAVADTGNGRIQIFDSSGKYLEQFGAKGATSSGTTFVEPLRIAAAPGGMLWVADRAGNRVAEFRESTAGGAERFVRDATGSAKQSTGKAEFANPVGVAVDPTGTLYVADQDNHRIQKFDLSGQFQSQFGSFGSGPGQLNKPCDIAIAASGNLLVTDQENSRVAQFQPAGHFVRSFGTKGSAKANFSLPSGITFGAGNVVFIADRGNNRIAKWTNADSDPQSGAAKGEVKLDGQKVDEHAPGCSTKNCGFSDEWTLKANQFSDGKHTIEVIATDAVGISSTKTLSVEVHPDKVGPSVVPTGSITQQASLGVTRPRYKLKVASSDGPLGEFPTPSDLIAAYSFDEGSGPVARDLFGSHDATIEGAKWSSGKYGSGLEFKASEKSKLTVPGTEDLRFQNFTLEAWVNPSESRFEAPVIAKTNVNDYGYILWAGGELAGKPEALITNKKSTAKYAFHNSALPHNTYTPLTVTNDGTNLRLYVNRELKDTRPSINVKAGTGDLNIGGSETLGYSEYFSGKLDELRLYNRALSGAEVAADQAALTAPPRQSGIVSTTITVDGKTVDSSSAGCTAENCVVPREWTLDSSAYSAGKHDVVMKATDGFGNTTSKTLSIEIQKDTTKPTLQLSGELPNAPEGWVEESEDYSFNASATDGGYGVTSLVLKIDGETVASKSQSCPDGACEATLTKSIDLNGYSGGAHPATVVATDGAGNTTTQGWTINIDPDGTITVQEAEETLEAVDVTSEANTVGPPEEEELEGTGEGLELLEGSESAFVAPDSLAPIAIEKTPEDGLSVEIPEEFALEAGCEEEGAADPGEEAAPPLTAEEEEDLALQPPGDCAPVEGPAPEQPELAPIQITPVQTAGAATGLALSDSEAAAISANLASHVDLITRPLFEGAMTFTAIRDEAGPETFSWEVDLEPEQELKLIDSQHAQVLWPSGIAAFSITAVPAHDAIGTAVPTSIAVSEGNILTLTVGHRGQSPVGGSFVYPVVGGAGWQGGFQTYQIVLPPGEEEGEEEEVGLEEGVTTSVKIISAGPPVFLSSAPADGLTPTSAPRKKKKFKFTYCRPRNIPADPIDGKSGVIWWNFKRGVGSLGQNFPMIISECMREDFEGVFWGLTTRGFFRYIPNHWVWAFPKEWDCRKWGEEQPAKIDCLAGRTEPGHGPFGAVHGPFFVFGEYRFRPGNGQWGAEQSSTCLVHGGELFPNDHGQLSVVRPMILKWDYVIPNVQQCNWTGLLSP